MAERSVGMRRFPRQPNLTLRRTHAETDSSDKAIVQSCDKLARRANRQKSVQPLLQKYFVSLVGQISGSTPPVYRDKRAIAIVTTVRWDAMDAKAATDERGKSVR